VITLLAVPVEKDSGSRLPAAATRLGTGDEDADRCSERAAGRGAGDVRCGVRAAGRAAGRAGSCRVVAGRAAPLDWRRLETAAVVTLLVAAEALRVRLVCTAETAVAAANGLAPGRVRVARVGPGSARTDWGAVLMLPTSTTPPTTAPVTTTDETSCPIRMRQV
jgi:hypothetical protein